MIRIKSKMMMMMMMLLTIPCNRLNDSDDKQSNGEADDDNDDDRTIASVTLIMINNAITMAERQKRVGIMAMETTFMMTALTSIIKKRCSAISRSCKHPCDNSHVKGKKSNLEKYN